MVKNLKEQSTELFFVEIKEPSEVRKNILETLKDILEVLQRFEKFRHIRHEKLENIQKLRLLLREENKLFGQVKAKLPQTNLRAITVRETPKLTKKAHRKKAGKGKTAQVKSEKPQKKEMTDIEKLESELTAIESKLKSLT